MHGLGPLVAGQRLVYTLNYRNSDAVIYNNAVISFALPAQTSFVSASMQSCSVAGGVVTCNLGGLAPMGTGDLMITVQTSPSATGTISSGVYGIEADNYPKLFGPPVQTAVKREDEQAFALANGQNLMFCEDAARRMQRALDADERIADFRVQATHHESLHPHDAVAVATKGIAGGYALRYRTDPDPIPWGEPFELEVWLLDAGPGAALAVDAAMPEHGHGMNRVAEVEALGDGRFRAAGLLFHMPGRWELYLDVTEGAVTERAQVEVVLE